MASAVVFDLDDTLVIDEASTDLALRATAEEAQRRTGVAATVLRGAVIVQAEALWLSGPHAALCERLGITAWEGLVSDAPGTRPELRGFADWLPAYRRETWHAALGAIGVSDAGLAEALGLWFQRERRMRQVLFDDGARVLETLRPAHRLALLTNGPEDLQREKLQETHLSSYFAVIVISAELGAGKPERLAFETVLDRLGVRSEDAVMVGDSLERDVVGARGAGLRSIWLNRGSLVAPEGMRADAEVHALSELLPLLN